MDASILEEKELKKYQDLEKLIRESEEIQFFTQVEFNRVDVLLALTNENFILYHEDYNSFGDDAVIRFSPAYLARNGAIIRTDYNHYTELLDVFYFQPFF